MGACIVVVFFRGSDCDLSFGGLMSYLQTASRAVLQPATGGPPTFFDITFSFLKSNTLRQRDVC